ncbi:MAG: hypothetical protein R2854_04445 [Caldilineaceae bacterium]
MIARGRVSPVIGLDWLLAAFALVAAEMPCMAGAHRPCPRHGEKFYYTPLIDRHPFAAHFLRGDRTTADSGLSQRLRSARLPVGQRRLTQQGAEAMRGAPLSLRRR